MSRVAVVGTSNIGCVKYALDDLGAAWPGHDIVCYGLPGARFDAARANDDGVFAPPDDDTNARSLAKRINGSVGIDLATFDHVLVLADTLGMPHTLWMTLTHDIGDWPTRRGKPLLSEPAFRSAMHEAIGRRVDHLAAQFAGLNRVHVALAPFPTTAVVPEGKYHQQPYAGISDHPEAARVSHMFHDALDAALAARGMTFVQQPAETVAQPFLTKECYGIGALDFRRSGAMLDDHRHMNPAFGASLFRAFALTLSQSQGPAPS